MELVPNEDKMKKFATLDELEKTNDTTYKDVDMTKEWGTWIRLGSLDAGTLLDYMRSDDKQRKGLRLLALSMVTSDGTRVVDPTNLEQVEKAILILSKKDLQHVGKVVSVALTLNHLNVDKKDVKNDSGKTDSIEPTTVSP